MILIAPDSFKGSLNAMEVARAMEAGIKRVWPEETIRLFPMADGGEGTLEAILAATRGAKSAGRASFILVPWSMILSLWLNVNN